MVQKASVDQEKSSSRGRGRPPKFDEQHVVESAIWAFFENGFDGTTLGDIEDATGVDRSTLYNSFGGKKGLYTSATRKYLDFAEAGLFEPLLHGGDDGFADLLDFLGRLRSGLTSETAIPGCLIVNDMATGSDPEAAQRYRDLLEEGLRRALMRAGDSDPERRAARAGLLSTSVLGVNLVSKITRGDTNEIDRLIVAMIDEVERWQADAPS